MTNWLVSRHQGAVDWIYQQGISIDLQVEHLDIEQVQPGDCVIGTLPIQLAAAVCARGARYLHLSVQLPFELRGQELDRDTLSRLGATLEEFEVRLKPAPLSGVRKVL